MYLERNTFISWGNNKEQHIFISNKYKLIFFIYIVLSVYETVYPHITQKNI